MVTFYIDSAEQETVTELLATGLFGGVTTNPAILDKAGLTSADIPDIIRWTTAAGAPKVFVQAWGSTAEELIRRGEQFRELSDRVVVKVPYSRHGVAAARVLSQGGEVLVTAVHAATQVLPIMATGASYFAPFIGRMDAAGRAGMTETLAAQQALTGSGSELRVLAGSLRTPEQMLELAAAGVQHMTLGPAVWDLFFTDQVTADATANFERLASLSTDASEGGTR